ncbi:SDR family NAD(P)-dependent oxidoreductase [Limnospira indica]|uniref:SDR family NAD(P)-dependent oxidoreductase n=1 Tax=Limnospira indica TaxID=147322 RepID=UPI002AA5BB75
MAIASVDRFKMKAEHGIITGGSSGIGLEIAKLLIQTGANITLIARDGEKLEKAARELEKLCPEREVLTLAADVSDRLEIEAAMMNSCDRLGTPDILVTSAGIAYPGYFLEIPITVFEQTMSVNYFGALYSVKAIVPLMVKRGKGTVVLISSGAGLIGLYGYAAYSPSKFALRGLAEALRGELKPLGIKIAVVYPPDTDTPQLRTENLTKPPETQQITATAGIWKPEDVAEAIVRGLEKGEFAITPGMEMTLLNRLHSLVSPGLNWYFDRLVAKISKHHRSHGGRIMNKSTREVAIAILYQSDKILLQLRDDIPTIVYPGVWGMFGGHIEPMETPLETMKRELLEEIGYVPTSLYEFGTYATEEVVRHVFHGPLEVGLEQLILGEGWDMELVTRADIIAGQAYSKQAGMLKAIGEPHRLILLDFLQA